MRTLLNTPTDPAHDSFVEKKSEFIGDACHADSVDDALLFVEMIREQHPKSRHVAYAALITGEDGRIIERMSDDGEPSGTAGKPILDVLRANDLTDTVVTVTRYFGGILLGSGGLIRAYSTGASIAVKAGELADIAVCERYEVDLQYPQLGTFQQLLRTMNATQDSADFTDHVALAVTVDSTRADEFTRRLTELFNATVVARPLGRVLRPVPVQ